MADRDRLLFDLCMALRQVLAGILRDLGEGRLPSDELAEKIVAERILEHLRLAPRAPPRPHGDVGAMIARTLVVLLALALPVARPASAWPAVPK